MFLKGALIDPRQVLKNLELKIHQDLMIYKKHFKTSAILKLDLHRI